LSAAASRISGQDLQGERKASIPADEVAGVSGRHTQLDLKARTGVPAAEIGGIFSPAPYREM
jgi:hypothetical protein